MADRKSRFPACALKIIPARAGPKSKASSLRSRTGGLFVTDKVYFLGLYATIYNFPQIAQIIADQRESD